MKVFPMTQKLRCARMQEVSYQCDCQLFSGKNKKSVCPGFVLRADALSFAGLCIDLSRAAFAYHFYDLDDDRRYGCQSEDASVESNGERCYGEQTLKYRNEQHEV